MFDFFDKPQQLPPFIAVDVALLFQPEPGKKSYAPHKLAPVFCRAAKEIARLEMFSTDSEYRFYQNLIRRYDLSFYAFFSIRKPADVMAGRSIPSPNSVIMYRVDIKDRCNGRRMEKATSYHSPTNGVHYLSRFDEVLHVGDCCDTIGRLKPSLL